MLNKKCSVERVERMVIERRLLARLEHDQSTVALLLQKEDLDLVIYALLNVTAEDMTQARKQVDMAADLKQLRREAFGR